MIRLRAILPLLLLLLCTAATAAAENGLPIYLAPKIGASFMSLDSITNTTNIANPAAVNKSSDDDTSAIFALAVGYDLGKTTNVPLRAEVEYAYRTRFNYAADPTFTNATTPTKVDIDLTVQSLFANLYLDIDTGTAFTPYVGAGLGAAFISTDGKVTVKSTGAESTQDNNDTNFAWNVGLGVGYSLTKSCTLDLGYRYADFGSMEMGNTAQLGLKAREITAHEVLLGLRYSFD